MVLKLAKGMFEIICYVALTLCALFLCMQVTSLEVIASFAAIYASCLFCYYHSRAFRDFADGLWARATAFVCCGNKPPVTGVPSTPIYVSSARKYVNNGKSGKKLSVMPQSVRAPQTDLPSPIRKNVNGGQQGSPRIWKDYSNDVEDSFTRNTQQHRFNNLDIGTILNVNSPGFTSRVLEKATEANHHMKYTKQAPRFDKSARMLSRLPRTPHTSVHIAPPEVIDIEQAGLNVSIDDSIKNSELLKRSALLKDSPHLRKRNYISEGNEEKVDNVVKRTRTNEVKKTPAVSKRALEESPEGKKEKICNKKRCEDTARNEYLNWLSRTSSFSILSPHINPIPMAKKRKSKNKSVDFKDGDKISQPKAKVAKPNKSILKKSDASLRKESGIDENDTTDMENSRAIGKTKRGMAEMREMIGYNGKVRKLGLQGEKKEEDLQTTHSLVETDEEFVDETMNQEMEAMKEDVLAEIWQEFATPVEDDFPSLKNYQYSLNYSKTKQPVKPQNVSYSSTIITSSTLNPLTPTASFGADELDANKNKNDATMKEKAEVSISSNSFASSAAAAVVATITTTATTTKFGDGLGMVANEAIPFSDSAKTPNNVSFECKETVEREITTAEKDNIASFGFTSKAPVSSPVTTSVPSTSDQISAACNTAFPAGDVFLNATAVSPDFTTKNAVSAASATSPMSFGKQPASTVASNLFSTQDAATSQILSFGGKPTENFVSSTAGNSLLTFSTSVPTTSISFATSVTSVAFPSISPAVPSTVAISSTLAATTPLIPTPSIGFNLSSSTVAVTGMSAASSVSAPSLTSDGSGGHVIFGGFTGHPSSLLGGVNKVNGTADQPAVTETVSNKTTFGQNQLFGGTTSSSTSVPAFGGASVPTTSTSIFGSQGSGGFQFGGITATTAPPTTVTQSGGFGFGNQQNVGGTNQSVSASVFGANSTTGNQGATGNTGIFGSTSVLGANATLATTTTTTTTTITTTSLFGTSTAQPKFGTSGASQSLQFGASNQDSSQFGSGGSFVFGGSTAQQNSTSGFGGNQQKSGNPQQQSIFGSQQQQPPAFGSNNQQPPAFGNQQQQPPAFGSQKQQPPAFGNQQQQPPAFGSNPQGGFGAVSPPAFGSAANFSAPTFGSVGSQQQQGTPPSFGNGQSSSVFSSGQQQTTPTFGTPAPTANVFGNNQPQQQTQQPPSSGLFGQQQQQQQQQQQNGGFGSAQASFGGNQQSGGVFGSRDSVFGAGGKGVGNTSIGSGTSSSGGMFGNAASAPVFGQQQQQIQGGTFGTASAFGSAPSFGSSTPAFGSSGTFTFGASNQLQQPQQQQQQQSTFNGTAENKGGFTFGSVQTHQPAQNSSGVFAFGSTTVAAGNNTASTPFTFNAAPKPATPNMFNIGSSASRNRQTATAARNRRIR